MKILIRQGRVVDPANGTDEVRDLFIDKGVVAESAKEIKKGADTVIEASGKIILPGLIDMHVHLREPGREDKETVETGTRAALCGGVTTVLAMPNTDPAIDCVENVRRLSDIVKKSAAARVLISGAMTRGRRGEDAVAAEDLKKVGVVALTDDGASVDNIEVMRDVLLRAKEAGLLVICHCEDRTLSGRGVVNLGYMSTCLGLRGIPREAEFKRIERDIELGGMTGCPVHIAHVSCRESVDIIWRAKKKQIRITAETAPHYFSLSEEALANYDTNFKINPPLRTSEDVAAIRGGLKDGTIDCIASDHAPHTENEKEIEFERAAFGVVGLETQLAAATTELVEKRTLSWSQLAEKLCANPARILGCGRGHLKAGAPADIAIVDPAASWIVRGEDFASKSRNSAFLGRTLKGRVTHTIRDGHVVFTR